MIYFKSVLQSIRHLFFLLFLLSQIITPFGSSSSLPKRGAYSQINKLNGAWTLWKIQHSRQYETYEDELKRFTVWMDNLAYIEEHNHHQEKLGYTLGMNHFGDIVSIVISTFLIGMYPEFGACSIFKQGILIL